MMGLGPPPGTKDRDPNVKVQVTETDDLRATKIAFILGRRSSAMGGVQPGAAGDPLESGRGFNQDPGYLADETDYGFQLAIHSNYSTGVPGTERFQKLCSFEYLHRYFTNVLCNKAVLLSKQFDAPLLKQWEEGSGVLRQVRSMAARAAAQNLAVDAAAAAGATGLTKLTGVTFASSSMLGLSDYAQKIALPGSDGADTAKTPTLRQGIFARDTGPFLRGKGSGGTGMIQCTVGGQPQAVDTEKRATQPFHLSRCMGDDVAFAELERVFEEIGITDWRPDGIVLSLGANDPSDKLSDEALAARDGQLFNVRIQGPAVTSTWTGNPALEVLPLDKVFIVIVADVWWDVKKDGSGDVKNAKGKKDATLAEVEAFLELVAPADGSPPVRPTRDALDKYLAAKEKIFSVDSGDSKITPGDVAIGGAFDAKANAAFQLDGTGVEKTRLVNFRPMVATSSQMINYSTLKFDGKGNQQAGREIEANAFARVPDQSRMGLRLSHEGGEYIVGGWCIGNVLDTSASRAAFPGAGTNIGVRTAPNTAALNVNVQIDWWDSDRMWRSFMNVEDSCKPRYVKTAAKAEAVLNPINRNPNVYEPSDTPKPLAYA